VDHLVGKIIPRIAIATSGKMAKINCISMGPVIWWKKGINGKEIPMKPTYEQNTYTLSFLPAFENDSGRYFCQGLNQYQHSFTAISDVYVRSK